MSIEYKTEVTGALRAADIRDDSQGTAVFCIFCGLLNCDCVCNLPYQVGLGIAFAPCNSGPELISA